MVNFLVPVYIINSYLILNFFSVKNQLTEPDRSLLFELYFCVGNVDSYQLWNPLPLLFSTSD